VTHPSKSKTRSVAAIGNGCVIPAEAGIHFATVKKPMDSRLRGNDEVGASGIAHPSKSKTRSVAAIGNGCVIPAAFSPRESGEGIHFDLQKPMDPRLRGDDGSEGRATAHRPRAGVLSGGRRKSA
jgi:hypothetical protein